MSNSDKDRVIIEEFQRSLEAARQAKTCGEILVRVKLHEGGIRDGRVTIERQVV